MAVSELARSSSASNSKTRVTSHALTSLVAALCVVLVSCTTRITPDAGGRVSGTVTGVVDGDTMRVSFGNRTEEIRLIGVDTPETVHPTKPVQCWGPEASSQTKTWLPKGTQVYILRDVEARDKYGRLLAYVYRSADNLFINKELVAGGWARPYPYEPNTSLQAVFAQAAYEAQTSNLGLWAHC